MNVKVKTLPASRQGGKVLSNLLLAVPLLAIVAAGGGYYAKHKVDDLVQSHAAQAFERLNQRFSGQAHFSYETASSNLRERAGILKKVRLKDAVGTTVAVIDELILSDIDRQRRPKKIVLKHIHGSVPVGPLKGEPWSIDQLSMDNVADLMGENFPQFVKVSLQQLQIPQLDDQNNPLRVTSLSGELKYKPASKNLELQWQGTADNYGSAKIQLRLADIHFHPRALSLFKQVLNTGNFYGLAQTMDQPESAAISQLEVSLNDQGAIEKLAQFSATDKGVSTAQVRVQWLQKLARFQKGRRALPGLTDSVVQELADFLNHSGSLRTSISPQPAIPFAAVVDLLQKTSGQSAALLNQLPRSAMMDRDMNVAIRAEY